MKTWSSYLLAGALLLSSAASAQTLIFAGGKSFRVHESPSIAMSADEGKTWTLVFEGARKNLDNPSLVSGLAYGGGKLVAVTTDGVVLLSADKGKTWSIQDVRTALNLNSGFKGLAYGGGMFVAAGSEDAFAYSLDGQHWQRLSADPIPGGGASDKAVASVGQAARSKLGGLAGKLGGGLGSSVGSSGATKAAPAAPKTHATVVDPREEVRYTHTCGVDFIDGKFYLAGNFGRVAVFVPEGGKPKRVSVSHVKDQLTSALRETVGDGKGNLVAFADGMMGHAYSPDGGSTWEEDFDNKHLTGGAYGNGRFLGVTPFGDVATSPNGKDWTFTSIARMNDGGSLNDAVYTGKNWVLCGNGNCTWYSADGKKWTRSNSDQLYLKRMLVVK